MKNSYFCTIVLLCSISPVAVYCEDDDYVPGDPQISGRELQFDYKIYLTTDKPTTPPTGETTSESMTTVTAETTPTTSSPDYTSTSLPPGPTYTSTSPESTPDSSETNPTERSTAVTEATTAVTEAPTAVTETTTAVTEETTAVTETTTAVTEETTAVTETTPAVTETTTAVTEATTSVTGATTSVTDPTPDPGLAAFEIVEVSSVSTDITESGTSVPGPDDQDIYNLLFEMYKDTTGFLRVNISDSRPVTTEWVVEYDVEYDVETLEAEGALDADDGIAQELGAVSDEILDHTDEVSGSWYIEHGQTEESLEEGNRKAAEKVENVCGDLGDVCPRDRDVCIYNDVNNTIDCAERCVVFRDEYPKCEGDSDGVVYLEGKCAYDDSWNAYCDCGKTSGDIMDNFFDGERCVSATFIVTISVLSAVLIIAILIGIIAYMASSNSTTTAGSEYKLDNFSEDLPYDGSVSAAGGSNRGGYTTFQTEAETEHKEPQAFDNKAYEELQYTPMQEESMKDAMNSDAYESFEANLDVVDPTVDYSIKRPNITSTANGEANHYQSDQQQGAWL